MYFIPLKGLYFSPYMSKRFTFSPKGKQTQCKTECCHKQSRQAFRIKDEGVLTSSKQSREKLTTVNCQNHSLQTHPYAKMLYRSVSMECKDMQIEMRDVPDRTYFSRPAELLQLRTERALTQQRMFSFFT